MTNGEEELSSIHKAEEEEEEAAEEESEGISFSFHCLTGTIYTYSILVDLRTRLFHQTRCRSMIRSPLTPRISISFYSFPTNNNNYYFV